MTRYRLFSFWPIPGWEMAIGERDDDFRRREKSVLFTQVILADEHGWNEVEKHMRAFNAAERRTQWPRGLGWAVLSLVLDETIRLAAELGHYTNTKSEHVWPAVDDLKSLPVAYRLARLEVPPIGALVFVALPRERT